MNRKSFLLLLGLALLLGAAGWLVLQQNHGAWENSGAVIGGKLLPGLAVNDIAELDLQSGTNTLQLARADGRWRVAQRGGYPANFSQISDLLLKCADLKMAQTEPVGPSQLGRFDLLPPDAPAHAGLQATFKDASGKTLATLLLGKKHLKSAAPGAAPDGMDGSWPDGRYVLPGAAGQTVALIADPLDGFQTQPEQWLDKDFLSMDQPAAIAVRFPAATNDWRLTRVSVSNDWQLADAAAGEKLDTSKIANVTSPFSSAAFNDVAAAASVANPATNTVLTVDTFDGLRYEARVGPAQNDNYPVRFTITAQSAVPAARLAPLKFYQDWVYYFPSYSVDEILKPRSQLLDTGTNAAPAAADK